MSKRVNEDTFGAFACEGCGGRSSNPYDHECKKVDSCDVALNDDGPWCTTHKQYLEACQKAGLWLAPKATEATFSPVEALRKQIANSYPGEILQLGYGSAKLLLDEIERLTRRAERFKKRAHDANAEIERLIVEKCNDQTEIERLRRFIQSEGLEVGIAHKEAQP